MAFNFPDDLKYTTEHEWVRMISDNEAYIGITDFAQSELGDLVYIEVETVGETLGKDEVFGTVEAVKTTSDLFLPVSGEILEFNEELDETKGDNATLVNKSPYDKGWIVRIRIESPEELDELLSVEEYKNLVG
ncbi:MAG: glycine cleavage system protein GcvH [Saprospiraceae bacterium]|nr:glycine cleavage system protein GcvH [Saprospiraceae bacterium]